MPLVTEFFNGGLVTVRDPSLLQPGELQQADECVYRLNDPAIFRAPGRTAYNAVALGAPSAIKGLGQVTFNDIHTDQLLAFVGTALFTSPLSAITGSFTEVTSSGQVLSCTLSGTGVTAAAGSFSKMLQGARVTGTGIPVGTTVNTVTSDTQLVLSKSCTAGTVTLTFDIGIPMSLSNLGTEMFDLRRWDNVYYGWFGAGNPQCIRWKKRPASGNTALDDVIAVRPMGLDPVTSAPTIATTVGTWSSVLGTGYYWFILTEIYAPGGDVDAAEKDASIANEIIESVYLASDPTSSTPQTTIGRPIVVQVTNIATQSVLITFPAVTNTGYNGRIATNWGIYMYGPTADNSTVPSFSLFRRVGTPPITQLAAGATFTLTDGVFLQTQYPTVSTAYGTFQQFTTPANMLNVSDNTFATAVANGLSHANTLTTFSFATGSPWNTRLILGIEIQVRGRCSLGSIATYKVQLNTGTGGTLQTTPWYTGSFGGNVVTKIHGGPLNTLGIVPATGDLTTTTVTIMGDQIGGTLAIDSIGIKIYFAGTTLNLNGRPYRVVTYRDQIGTTVDDPADLPPPQASTGDIFQGMLVLDDLSDRGLIRYSLPGYPESFPKPYFLKFKTGNGIRLIKRLGQILIVGMREAIQRVNYLPTEIDTDPQQGLAHEEIASDHGIAGPLAGCLFSMPGRGQVLAYIASNGIHVTDGITTDLLNTDLNFKTLIDPAYLQYCVLRNYPREQWLVFYYAPFGGTGQNTKAIIFSYAKDKVKDTGLPALGPISISGRSASSLIINELPYLVTGHAYDGTVYIEDSGTAIPATYTTDGVTSIKGVPVIVTRRFYPSGLDRNAREERIYILSSTVGAVALTTNCVMTKGSTTITAASGNPFNVLAKGMLVQVSNLPADTIILSISDNHTLILSNAAFEDGTFSTIFDNTTLSVTVRGQNISESPADGDTSYLSLFLGGLIVGHNDNARQALEMRIEKVQIPDYSTPGSTIQVDHGTDMRLHYFAYDLSDAGKEQNRGS